MWTTEAAETGRFCLVLMASHDVERSKGMVLAIANSTTNGAHDAQAKHSRLGQNIAIAPSRALCKVILVAGNNTGIKKCTSHKMNAGYPGNVLTTPHTTFRPTRQSRTHFPKRSRSRLTVTMACEAQVSHSLVGANLGSGLFGNAI